MTFKFNPINTPRSADESGSGSSDRKQVDYDALNAHLIHASGTATKSRSIPGIVSGIIDLGIQEREPFEGPWNEKDAAKPGAEEFLDNKGKRSIRVPLKPVQQIAITIDFPQILVNKGQFFGDGPGEELPLRMLLNGEFGFHDDNRKWVSTVRRGFVVSEIRDEKTNRWAISKQNSLHKLADAAGILDEDGLFVKERIGELLGTAAQFQMRVYLKPGSGSKQYLTEEIKLAGQVPEGVPVPILDERHLIGINFTGENNPEEVKKLRRSIRNSIKLASNYSTSDIKKIIDEIEAEYSSGNRSSQSAPVSPSKAAAGAPATSGTSKPPGAAVEAPDASEGDAPAWDTDDDDELPF